MAEPAFTGIGRAWLMEVGEHANVDQGATIVGYVVNGPWHPMWSWWMVSVVHLRDLPGVRPANKHYPEAEYEFLVMSINPDTPPDPDQTFPQDLGYLEPADVVVQFDGVTDEQARSICADAARMIAEGGQSPDSDFRSWWKGAIANTVAHYKAGVH